MARRGFLLVAMLVCVYTTHAQPTWLRVTFTREAATLNAVCSTPTRHFIAVGEHGVIQRGLATDSLVPVAGDRTLHTLNDVLYHPQYGVITAGNNGRVLRSTDDGLTFSPVQAPSIDFTCLATDSSGVVWAGTREGLYRSTGWPSNVEWERVGGFGQITAMLCVKPHEWLVGTLDSAVYRFNDQTLATSLWYKHEHYTSRAMVKNGAHVVAAFGAWAALSLDTGATVETVPQITFGGCEVTGMTVLPDGKILAAVDGDVGGGLWLSVDPYTFFRSQLGNPRLRDVAANDSTFCFVGTEGTYIGNLNKKLNSRDSIERLMARAKLRQDYHSWQVVRGDRRHLMALGGFGESSVMESLDSGRTFNAAWIDTCNSVDSRDFIEPYDLLELEDGSHLLIADTVWTVWPTSGESRASILRREAGGTEWKRVVSTKRDSLIQRGTVGPNGVVLLWGYKSAYWRSTDHGASWTKHKRPFNDTIWSSTSHGQFIYAMGSALHVSTDAGITWLADRVAPSKYGTIKTFHTGRLLVTDAYHRTPGFSQGYLAWVSDDQGQTWRTTLADTAQSVASFGYRGATSKTKGHAGIAGTNQQVRISTDYGETWTITSVPARDPVDFVHASFTPDGWLRVAGFNNEMWELDMSQIPSSVFEEYTLTVSRKEFLASFNGVQINVQSDLSCGYYVLVDLAGRVAINGKFDQSIFSIPAAGLTAGVYGLALSDGRVYKQTTLLIAE